MIKVVKMPVYIAVLRLLVFLKTRYITINKIRILKNSSPISWIKRPTKNIRFVANAEFVSPTVVYPICVKIELIIIPQIKYPRKHNIMVLISLSLGFLKNRL